jgi:outer membrane murein-binding lipoprotein Lpp
MRPTVALAALSSLVVAGCVTAAKEREVLTALRGVGFTETDARCLAARAGRRLSVRQLRSLEQAARAMPTPVAEKPVGEVVAAIRDNVDAQTLRLVAELTVECAKLRLEGRLEGVS